MHVSAKNDVRNILSPRFREKMWSKADVRKLGTSPDRGKRKVISRRTVILHESKTKTGIAVAIMAGRRTSSAGHIVLRGRPSQTKPNRLVGRRRGLGAAGPVVGAVGPSPSKRLLAE